MLTNAQVAELLARAAETEEGHRERAYRRAAWAALAWPEEVAALASSGRSLTELRAVGPWLARTIASWLEEPPEVPEPPPIRRGFSTLAEARGVLARAPEWRTELQADLQMHTTWSDGSADLASMIDAAAGLGHRYVAITDHSKGLRIARGMDEATLARQIGEIRAASDRLEAAGSGITALPALEMNVSPAGEGDMDPGVLAELDLVLGAFHSKLRTTEDQTERYLAAVRNPQVHVLAHPRGRKYNNRLGLEADWRRVFEEAAATGKALEVDAYPDRQDLQPDLLALAAEVGITISIGTDAHHPDELRFIDLGLAAVITAGVPRDRILNFLSPEGCRLWAREASGRRTGV